jgi:ATP-dependent exoDNAse (exonuclease V) beta subunit
LSRKKKFHHELIEFEKLERVTTDEGRYYVLPDGTRARSVTSVLGEAADKTALMEWKRRVGEKEANRISTQAARRGTAFHAICENYLLNEDSFPPNTMPTNIDSFKLVRPYLDEHVGTVYGIEAMVYSKELRAAGTADLIAQWDGVTSIIDFKTSKRLKREDWIEGYFLQATTYALMVEGLTGMEVPQIVILISVDDELPQLFIKNKEQYVKRVEEIFK